MLRRDFMIASASAALAPTMAFAAAPAVSKIRLIVTPGMLPGTDGNNINGPSLLKVPDWVPNRLGRYYLYFAHHKGTYIRLAYSDNITGPYTVYAPGTLRLSEAPLLKGHIASPDMHIDEARKQIVMYFHGPSKSKGDQLSYRATSPDGINFSPTGTEIGASYFRVWQFGELTYALGRARLYRSEDAGNTFEEGQLVISVPAKMVDIRHTAVRVLGDKLEVYYTVIGDAPESIYFGTIDMRQPWGNWQVTGSASLLQPTEEWEGAKLPIEASRSGPSPEPENAVRDPAVFEDDGRAYLLYSVMGEMGIAIAGLAS